MNRGTFQMISVKLHVWRMRSGATGHGRQMMVFLSSALLLLAAAGWYTTAHATGGFAPPKAGKATMHIPPPKIRLISETHHVDTTCADMHRLITFNMHLRNDGGPLAAHKWEIWVEDDQGVLPYNGVAYEKWIPPLMSGDTANVTVPVGVLQRNIGQLPGAHSVAIGYYNGYNGTFPNGMRTIARKHVTIMLPKGICQPKRDVLSPARMHLKVNRAGYPPSPCIGAKCKQDKPKLNLQSEPPSNPPGTKLNPQPEPPSSMQPQRRLPKPRLNLQSEPPAPVHRMRLPAVQ